MRRIQITGLDQRTISSTATGAKASKSLSQKARWSGLSVSATSAWLRALRVVSLPATDSSTKKDAISRVGQPLALDLSRGEGRHEVAGRGFAAQPAQLGDELGELRSGGQQHGSEVAALRARTPDRRLRG